MPLACAIRDEGRVLGIDVPDLDGEVAVSGRAYLPCRRDRGVLSEADKRVTAPVPIGSGRLQPKGNSVELVKRCGVPDCQFDLDPADPVHAGWHQPDGIPIGIAEFDAFLQPGPRDCQLPVAAGRDAAKGIARLVDLQHGSVHPVPVLPDGATQWQQLLKRQADLPLPERQHLAGAVREQPNINVVLCQSHRACPSFLSVSHGII